MKALWPILLQTAAFAVAMAELILPSFGVLTLVCIGLIGYSWYLIWTTLPQWAALLFLLADMALIPAGFFLGIRLMGRSPMSHRSDIGQGTGMEADEKRLQDLIGHSAMVEAMLRPAGKIRIGNEIYEAMTNGELIEKGREVRVTSLQAGALRVEAMPTHAETDTSTPPSP